MMLAKLAKGAFVIAAAAGCVGDIGGRDGNPETLGRPSSGGGPMPPPIGGAAPPMVPVAPGVPMGTPTQMSPRPPGSPSPPLVAGTTLAGASVRRLGRLEYENTIQALIGERLTLSLPDDPETAYGFRLPAAVGDVELAAFVRGAEAAAAKLALKLDQLAPCAGAADEACAGAFVTSFGRRAFRRPVTQDEHGWLLDVYRNARMAIGYDHREAMRTVASAILQAPAFIHLFQLGATPPEREAGRLRLSTHELAARLSYALWLRPPDDELARAADTGALAAPQELERQARRLLLSPNTQAAAWDVFDQLFHLGALPGLQKNEKVYPLFTNNSSALRSGMTREAQEFARFALLETGDLRSLFTSRVSFINEPLARVYGLSGVTGPDFRRVDLPATRPGGLTRAAFLMVAAYPSGSSPVRRGKVIRENLLCQLVPPPPPALAIATPTPKPGAQTRELFTVHMQAPACSSCHARLDPLGFGLEAFDGIAQHRTMEEGRPVDTSGSVTDVEGGPRPFKNAEELAEVLAALPETQRCMAQQWARYLVGRDVSATGPEADVFKVALERFAAAKLDVRELIVAVAMSPAFRLTPPVAMEIMP